MEKPTVEKPVVESKPEATKEDSAKELLAKLESLGIESPEKIDGMVTASHQAGNLANQLGEERRLRRELEERLARAQHKPTPTPENMEYGETVDLGHLIDSKVESVLERFWDKKSREQVQMHEAQMREHREIVSDPDYQFVKDIYAKHLENPDVISAINSGYTTRTKEYNKVARQALRVLAKQSHGVIKDLTSRKSDIPHIESSDTLSKVLPPEHGEKNKKLKKIVDRDNWRGTDDDVRGLVDEFFKDNPLR